MKERIDISKFDKIGNLWENIKNDSRIQEIYVIKEPELVLRLYDRFRNKRLGKMFVEAYEDVSEYNEQAYFISCELGKPIERMNISQLTKSLDDYENHLAENSQFNAACSAIRDRKKIRTSAYNLMIAKKIKAEKMSGENSW